MVSGYQIRSRKQATVITDALANNCVKSTERGPTVSRSHVTDNVEYRECETNTVQYRSIPRTTTLKRNDYSTRMQ